MMGNLSLLEKLKIFVDVSSSSGICVASICILIFMILMFFTTNRKNKKIMGLLFIGIYVSLILVMLFQYREYLMKMFDYMMNNFFIVFYFPNLAIYLAAIITTNIILFTSIFSLKVDNLLKGINIIVYSIIHYLLILILNIVNTKKLDVFSQTSIYSDEKAAALISLTSIIFIIWVVFLIIYKSIRLIQKGKMEEFVETKYIEVPIKKVNPNIIKVSAPITVNSVMKRKIPEVIPVEQLPPKLVPIGQNQIIEDVKPAQPMVEENQELLKEYENMFTLEDYKLVLDILKGNREKINQDSNSHTIMVEEKEESICDISPVVEPKENKDPFPSKLDQLLNI